MSSIYERILEGIKSGTLSDDILSFKENEVDGVPFANGALDGIYLYHMPENSLNASDTRLLMKAVNTAAEGDFDKAESSVKKLTEEQRVICFTQKLINYVSSHKNRLEPNNVYSFALHLTLKSADVESVKFGLVLLSHFDTEDAQTMDIIRNISLCEEFTFFCVWIMSSWSDSNKELFKLCKKVHGWGRIHAINMLECTDDKIRRWLLSEGRSNSVLPGYSAHAIWDKIDCKSLLDAPDISYEMFRDIGELLACLSDDEPVAGFSAMDDAEEIVGTYLSKCEEFDLQIEDFEIIGRILLNLDEKDSSNILKAQELLSTPQVEDIVHEAVKLGKGIKLALDLDIDAYDDFFEYFEAHFFDAVNDIGYLFTNPDYIPQTIKVVEEHTDAICFSGTLTEENNEDYRFLIPVLETLCSFPLEGKSIVEKSLFAPSVSVRKMALSVLTEWCKEEEKQLEKLSPNLYELTEKLRKSEINKQCSELIDILLNGQVSFNNNPEDDEDDE